jgi:hypothetical protein
MDEATLQGICAGLVAAIAEELQSGRSKKWRCPAGLRSQILVYAGICRESGEPLGDIAGRLGLVESTLARWLRRERTLSPTLRPVAIITRGERGQPDKLGSGSAGLRLVSPRGYLVEGLELHDLARLLQVVG